MNAFGQLGLSPRRALAALWTVAGLGMAPAAFGMVPPMPPPTVWRGEPSPDASEKRWYGYQTLITDGVAVAFAGAAWKAAFDENTSLAVSLGAIALGDYLLAPPVVHIAHSHAGKALGSLALRSLAPILFLGVGGESQDESSDAGCQTTGFLGVSCSDARGVRIAALVFVPLVAIAVDASFLAWDHVPKASARLRLAPWLDRNGRAGFAVNGVF